MSEAPPASTRRRRLVAALAVLAGLGLAAWGGRHLWAWHHFRAGRAALEADDLDAARGHFDDCLRVWRGSAEARLLAARAARRAGDLDAAERQLSEHQLLGGDTEVRTFEWAMLHAQKGELRDTPAYLRGVARGEGPEGELALEALGKGYYDAGRVPEALACAEDLLRRRPDHFQGLVLRGLARETLGEFEQSLRDYEAAAARPASFEARVRRAGALERVGRLADAVAEYEALRRSRPDHAEVLLALARLRHDCHQLDEAEALLQQLLEAHPDDARALSERARVALRRGEASRAEQSARAAMVAAPYDRDAFGVLALALEAQGKTEEARAARTRLDQIVGEQDRLPQLMARAQAAPNDLAVQYTLGVTLLQVGHTEQGLRALRGVLERDPDHAAARAALADYAARTREPAGGDPPPWP